MQGAERALAAPAPEQGQASGGSVRPGLALTERGKVTEVTAVHQRGPEARQEGSRSLVKALPGGREVLSTVM